MNTIKHSEEFNGLTTIFLQDETRINIPTSYLSNLIQDRGLNVTTETTGSGLVCDPYASEDTSEVFQEVETYLDNNWDSVVELYYKEVICGA